MDFGQLTVPSLVQELREKLGRKGQLAFLEVLSARTARYGELDDPLPSPIAEELLRRGIRLYLHQAEAIRVLRRGEDIILATPTASGKSLAFQLPVLEALVKNPFSTALYIYPLKALANDQLNSLLLWEENLGTRFRPSIYDGDTPTSLRRRILERSRVILTNPYALHEYLPWHHLWRRFFMNLKYIVIDEAHVYRGVFGSHFSCLFRRLERLLKYYRSCPRVILSSATVKNPEEFGEKLTGKSVRAVTEDGSPRGQKFFLLWNPALAETGERRSSHLEVRDLALFLHSKGLQTLCFTGSRALSELLTRWAKKQLSQKGEQAEWEVATYRAGYLAEDRRELERRLRQGELRTIFSTNALELGIDIGSLDAVIIAGYPGTMISTWQQAGRAGRGKNDSLVILVAYPNPLDQYFINHPERFFSHRLESLFLNPSNPHVLRGHLQCAARELPLEEAETAHAFGEEALSSMRELELAGLLRMGHYQGSDERTSAIVSLNSIEGQPVQLVSPGGELLETLDLPRALREAYPGAIFLHQGEAYYVERLDLKEGTAIVRPIESDIYTQVKEETSLSVLGERRHYLMREGVEVFFGKVRIQEQILGYYRKKFDRILDYRELNLPPVSYLTESAWFSLPPLLEERARERALDFEGGLHALEHSLIAMIPVFTLSDRWDLGGISYPQHPSMKGPAVFLYDGAPGGVGIAEKVQEILPDLLRTTLEMVRDCPCEDGCPSCILSPKCGNNNQPISKPGAVYLLEQLLQP